MSKVFISGSISIKSLPSDVIESLNKIQENNIEVLVGDADGIDIKIQDFYNKTNYQNVCVYSIYAHPRNLSSTKFKSKTVLVDEEVKKEREKQTFKDEAMTSESDYSFIIWDGKSKGSYNNILRAMQQNKKIKIYLASEKCFLQKDKINKNEIDFIYYENNGYSAKEIVDFLQNEGKSYFKNSRELNKFLLDGKIIEKNDGVYVPLKHKELFIVESYRGKITGIKFTNRFIDWLDENINMPTQQDELF